ncbi:MAG TPA: hypothetical protein VJ933_11105, partial [Phaeodactylibacter sp.]|nr:hypothetical protein [Phaeodactylibacter sp.]
QTKQAEPATKAQEASKTVAHEEKLRQFLLDRKPSQTESQAFKWVGENPENNLYRVYIVLGRVYQGKYDKARDLWFFFKDKTLNDGQNFTDKVVAEIDRLEKLGATNTGIKRFRNQIARE